MEHKAVAEVLFCSGCNCAQAVFAAFCDETGLDKDTAMKIASSFGAGMGKMREVCGACTGAFAVAGMLWGYTDTENEKAKAEHYQLVRRIADEFKARNGGTIICRELLVGLKDIDSKNPHPRTEEYYKVRPCVRFVSIASEILDEIILEKSQNREEIAAK